MSRQPLAIAATGMVTGVGLDAPSSCAAIRAAIDNFQDTRFMDSGGDWIQGCDVPLEEPWRGTRKLAKMLVLALQECAGEGGFDLADVPVILCLAEKERPGRTAQLGNRVFFESQEELGIRFHEKSLLVEQGRVSALVAMKKARSMIYEHHFEQVVIAGVDSLLHAQALRAYEEQDRILTSQNSDGFIPGEAAAAIVIRKPATVEAPQLVCLGLGFGVEHATLESEEPLRADGLVQAIKDSVIDANTTMEDLDFRIADVSGEQYWFKESSLALLRTLHTPQEEFDIWHPADCIGEVGAAIGLVIFIVAKTACEKGYSKGANILGHFSNNDGKRGASVWAYQRIAVEL